MENKTEELILGLNTHFCYLDSEAAKLRYNASMHYEDNDQYSGDKLMEKAQDLRKQMLKTAEAIIKQSEGSNINNKIIKKIIEDAKAYVNQNNPEGPQPGSENN